MSGAAFAQLLSLPPQWGMIVLAAMGVRTVSTSFPRISALLVPCLLATLYPACGSPEEPDSAVTKPVSFTGDPSLIIGTWIHDATVAELGMRFESETTYEAPDRFVARGKIVSLVTGKEQEFEIEGQWAIKGGLLTTRLEESNSPLFQVGSGSSRRIDVLDDKEFVCTEAGQQLRMVRKPS
jgi:hypothetical protein